MLRETLLLRAFGFLRIPLIFFVNPSVVEVTDKKTVVRIPLGYRTKNHLGSMYFGVLCTGADCAAGLVAMKLIRPFGKRASMVFKDFSANFLKRPDADVDFVCEEGDNVAKLVERAVRSGERENLTVKVTAMSKGEAVATFTLTLSIKIRKA